MYRTMKRLVATVCVAVAVLTSSAAAPAQADQASFADRAGDVGHPMDILRVTASTVSSGHQLVVTVRHRAVTARNGAWSGLYIDVTPGSASPDYYLGAVVGGVYQLYRTDGWKVGARVGCSAGDYRFGFNTRADTTRFSLSRRCLDGTAVRPTRARVAAFAGVTGGRQDWAPGYHRYSRWLPLR